MVTCRQVTPETIDLFGGRLSLDFANTVDWSQQRTPLAPELDALREPQWLTLWGERVGVLSAGEAPAVTHAEHRATRELRSVVYGVFAAIGEDEQPDHAAIDKLRNQYAQAVAHSHLADTDNTWRLSWDTGHPRTIRYAVAVDAVGLLTDHQLLGRVQRCPGVDCGWLFINASGRRRWCSMQTCGSRAKMRRLRSK